MANLGELTVGIDVDEKSLKKSTEEIQDEFEKTSDKVEKDFKKSTSKIGGIFAGLGPTIAGVFSVGAIVAFSKQLIGLGSDLEETQSKFDVVFQSSKRVNEQYEELAKNTNRSVLELKIAGATTGSILKPLGLQQELVGELSVSINKLAIDVASFNNASDEQVIHAFNSALVGEREALKTLGIVINEADVSQKAYNLGLVEQGESLTKAQKALATYQLLLENTTDAQGDAVRTSASFANQLKGLQGAITDVFSQAGKDIAQETAGLLKNITVFVATYGRAIITTIINAGKVIGSALKDIGEAVSGVFEVFSDGSKEAGQDVSGFANGVQKAFFYIATILKGFALVFKSVLSVVKILLNTTVDLFNLASRSIGEGWDGLKNIFFGTIKTIIDIATFGSDAIGNVFVGMAEAIIGVFKGIGDNIAVAIKKAVNGAISVINGFIDVANKIPGVDFNRLAGFQDTNFKPFELKVAKNIDKIKGDFADLGKSIKGNYSEAGKSIDKISSDFTKTVTKTGVENAKTLIDLGNDWSDFGENVLSENNRINKSIEKSGDIADENAKKYDTGYFQILGILDDYKGGLDDVADKTKEQGKIADKAIDSVKKQYKAWGKSIKEVGKAQIKLAKDTKEFNEDLIDDLDTINDKIQKNTKSYEDNIALINKETGSKLSDRLVGTADELKTIEEEIADLEKKGVKGLGAFGISEADLRKLDPTTRIGDDINTAENVLKLFEANKKLKEIEEERALIIENTTQKQRDEAERVAGLSSAEKIKEEADAEIAEKTRIFNAEQERLESLARINKFFQENKELDEKTLNKIMEDERFAQLSKEERDKIISLAKERIELTDRKNSIIALEEEVFNKTVELSNSATLIQAANIQIIKDEYADLISEIDSAILKQRELQTIGGNSGAGFASGGFTGSGSANEVAGVVHKGEWVAPKHMVDSMKPMFDHLEGLRQNGGQNNTTNKTQNNNITVNNGADLNAFLDYAKWKQ